ncbi:MAG: ribonuclease HII [Gammaproteobacteria bacterium]|nr:ribonuclease HII [Gammaproteobacteria bacterium]
MVWPSKIIVGLDEAGRGPLAGKVYAAAVVLGPDHNIDGLRDSKKLSEAVRESLNYEIKEKAFAFGIAYSDPDEIDQYNIHVASLLAMKRAYLALSLDADIAFVDGLYAPDLGCSAECVVGGDNKVQEIMAASILAKYARDCYMDEMDKIFPQYGFKKNKGYPTKFHKEAILDFGITPIHRKSFGPCKSHILDKKKSF